MLEDILLYLHPVSEELAEKGIRNWNNQVFSYTQKNVIPCREDDFQIAMVVVHEPRNTLMKNSGFTDAGEKIRHFLYGLYPPGKHIKLLDLGDILPGHDYADTYFALRKLIDTMIRKNKFLIIIGSHKDLVYPHFAGYQELEQTVNMVCLGHTVDISLEEEPINNTNYLSSIILHQPNFLFNLSIYGMQEYFVDPRKMQLLDKLYFDTHRLGEFRDNPKKAEPVLRMADMITLDLGSLKYSDFPAQYEPMANGFTSEEICLLARYCGLSDKLSSFGIYEYNSQKDAKGLGALLISQILWCLMDGIQNRKNDFPSRSSNDYIRYHVMLENGQYEINFYKSKKSGRWWMEVPYPPQKGLKYERHTLVPCSEEDYIQATKNDVPDRWLLTYNKLL